MKRAALLFGFVSLVSLGCDGRITDSEPPVPGADALLRQNLATWSIIPVGDMPSQAPALVALGRALFFDKILSGNRDIACSSCHQPARSLGDGLSLAVGTGATGLGTSRAPGSGRTFAVRHAPSLLNSGLGMFYMFWDGRLTRFGHVLGSQLDPTLLPASSNALVTQAMLTVLNRLEMRGNAGDTDAFGNTNELAQLGDHQPQAVWQAIMRRLTANPEYVELFKAAFPARPANQLIFEDAARALAAFQMQAFTTTNSPFDRYLGRDNAALTAEQKRGATLFFGKARCATCHNGPFLGGQGFANTGVPQIGPGASRQPPLDLGQGEFQDHDFYRFAFRIAPLRNIELTGPYMHNGAYPTLEAVVNHYNDVPHALRTYDVSQLTPALRELHHGDDATVSSVLATVDSRVRQPLELTEDEKHDLVVFLKSLTDPAARDLSALVPLRVPSGLPVEQ